MVSFNIQPNQKSNVNYTLFMGTENSQNQKQNTVQAQIIDQNYSNNIMMQALSTLESISRKLLKKDGRRDNKKYGSQDKVDYSSKTLAELISQLKTHLFLFKISKQQMEEDFKTNQGFVFPKNFPKDLVLKEISIFKEICYQAKDPNLLKFCEDFINIINGRYSNLSIQKTNVKVQYSSQETKEIRKDFVKNGIHATQAMDQLRNKAERLGISNQSDLTVAFNKTDIDYERQGKKIIQKFK